MIMFIGLVSCKLPNTDKQYAEPGKNVYQLGLSPNVGSKYYYEISNESDVTMEIDEKEMETLTNSEIGIHFEIDKDTAGNFLFTMSFDKIKVETNKQGVKTVINADNSYISSNPAERMMGVLKSASIVSTISPQGETRSVQGYKELGDKILANFRPDDAAGKQAAQKQWEQFIGEGFIKKNITQLFQIFPDSAVHVGDKWRIFSDQHDEFKTQATTFYSLKEINDGIATIESKGEMKAASPQPINIMGYNVIPELQDEQKGEYELDIKTGMLLRSRITSNIKGTLSIMGREIPVEIEYMISVKART